MAKLLLHRIPTSVPREELHKIVPGDFTIEIKVTISNSFARCHLLYLLHFFPFKILLTNVNSFICVGSLYIEQV